MIRSLFFTLQVVEANDDYQKTMEIYIKNFLVSKLKLHNPVDYQRAGAPLVRRLEMYLPVI